MPAQTDKHSKVASPQENFIGCWHYCLYWTMWRGDQQQEVLKSEGWLGLKDVVAWNVLYTAGSMMLSPQGISNKE